MAFDTTTGTLFAATTAGGVFRSTDDGLTWKEINDGLPALNARRIVVGPQSTLFVYIEGVGAGRYYNYKRGLYRSTDQGASWVYADVPNRLDTLPLYHTPLFSLSPDGILYTWDTRLFRSTDLGTTWEPLGPPVTLPTWFDMAADAQGRIVFVTSSVFDGVHIFSGDTWRTVKVGAGVVDVEAFGDYVLAGTTSGIYRSSDGGASWVRVTSKELETRTIMNFRGRNGEIFASNDNGHSSFEILRSTNNGATWSAFGDGWNDKIVLRGKNAVMVGSDTDLRRSVNEGVIWRTVTEGLSARDIRSLTVSPSGSIFAMSGYTTLFRSTDRGGEWEPLDARVFKTTVLSNGHLIGSMIDDAVPGLHRSTDDGATWTPIEEFDNLFFSVAFVKGLPGGHVVVVYAKSQNLSIWLSDDYGSTWSLIVEEAPQYDMLTPSDAVMLSPTEILISSDDNDHEFLRCTRTGETWGVTHTKLGRVMSMAVDGRGAVWAAGGGLYRSTDGGVSWENRIGDLSSFSGIAPAVVSTVEVTPNGKIFVSTLRDYGTVFMSTDHGESWKEVHRGVALVPILDIAVDSSGYLYLGTEGHGILRSTISTSVPVNRAAEEFAVETIPNPTTSSTLLRFPMQTGGRVTVTVHSLPGEHIATLYDGEHEAGTCELRWDAVGAPSGIYLYRIETDLGSACGELRVVR